MVWVEVPLPTTAVAVSPPRFAPVAAAKVTSTEPFEWVVLVLLGWHSVQASAL